MKKNTNQPTALNFFSPFCITFFFLTFFLCVSFIQLLTLIRPEGNRLPDTDDSSIKNASPKMFLQIEFKQKKD